MKIPVLFTAIAVSVLFLSSCGNKTNTNIKDILPQYELTAEKDTINYVDVNGLKQGHWIVYEKGPADVNTTVTYSADSLTNLHTVSYSGVIKIEEGFYKNDKKTGLWKNFSKDGSVKDSSEHTIH